MSSRRDFGGINEAYVAELYERYRQDPASVDAATRAAFERWTPPSPDRPGAEASAGELSATQASDAQQLQKIVGVVNLAESIRMHPGQEELKSMMEAAGLARVEYFNLAAGVVALHRGWKV